MEILKKTAAFRVQKQTEGLDPAQVRAISLSGVPLLPELLAPLTGLTGLTLVFMKPKITFIAEVPLAQLPGLRTLEVSDNAITVAADGDGSGTAVLPVCTSMKRLLLANNRVASMAEVAALAAAFPSLEVLDLADNPLDLGASGASETFRAVFALFPSLVALNARDANGEEVIVEDSDESDEESEYDDEDGSDSESESESSCSDDDAGSSSSTSVNDDDADAPERQRARTEAE